MSRHPHDGVRTGHYSPPRPSSRPGERVSAKLSATIEHIFRECAPHFLCKYDGSVFRLLRILTPTSAHSWVVKVPRCGTENGAATFVEAARYGQTRSLLALPKLVWTCPKRPSCGSKNSPGRKAPRQAPNIAPAMRRCIGSEGLYRRCAGSRVPSIPVVFGSALSVDIVIGHGD